MSANDEVLDKIIETKKKMGDKPVIVVMNLENPAVVSEFEDQIEGLLIHFNVSNQALFDIMSGEAEPSGLLPFQMPEDMLTVEQQLEDVGRDMEPYSDEAGHSYDFGYGLSWEGVIKDDRVKKYATK